METNNDVRDTVVLVETKSHRIMVKIPTKGTDSPLTTHQEVILELQSEVEELRKSIEIANDVMFRDSATIQQLQSELATAKAKQLQMFNDLADAKGWTRAVNISEVNYMSELEKTKAELASVKSELDAKNTALGVEKVEILNEMVKMQSELSQTYLMLDSERRQKLTAQDDNKRLRDVVEGLKDMISLASGLSEDDGWFAERRDAEERIKKAQQLIASLERGQG